MARHLVGAVVAALRFRARRSEHRAGGRPDRCYEIVAAPGYRNDVAPARTAVAQRPPQRTDLRLGRQLDPAKRRKARAYERPWTAA
jgi:hypothetical protein